MGKIDLFCGINSLGVPFPRENKDHIGYFDLAKENVVMQDFDVNTINISSLNQNHTWNLEKILNLDYSLSKIKNV